MAITLNRKVSTLEANVHIVKILGMVTSGCCVIDFVSLISVPPDDMARVCESVQASS